MLLNYDSMFTYKYVYLICIYDLPFHKCYNLLQHRQTKYKFMYLKQHQKHITYMILNYLLTNFWSIKQN